MLVIKAVVGVVLVSFFGGALSLSLELGSGKEGETDEYD